MINFRTSSISCRSIAWNNAEIEKNGFEKLAVFEDRYTNDPAIKNCFSDIRQFGFNSSAEQLKHWRCSILENLMPFNQHWRTSLVILIYREFIKPIKLKLCKILLWIMKTWKTITIYCWFWSFQIFWSQFFCSSHWSFRVSECYLFTKWWPLRHWCSSRKWTCFVVSTTILCTVFICEFW